MCGIAEVLLNLGYEVSGSDIKESSNVKYLRLKGACVNIGHSPKNLDNPHVVVTSSALSADNSEVKAASEKNIPVIPRAEMLCELMRLKYALCVAGTHGKTTTTSMMGLILSRAGLDPTVVVGGLFKNLKSNAQPGGGEFMVAEADESDGSFLKLTPTIAIVTNIDNDHMSYYGSLENLKDTFTRFLNKVPFYGFSVLCGDDRNLTEILGRLSRPYVTYGMSEENSYRAVDIRLGEENSSYSLVSQGKKLGTITVRATGKHNILNSLAASAAALEMDIDFSLINEAIFQYQGVSRRLEKKAEKKEVVFYDDYAHHPSAIKLALKSLREIYPSRRLIVVFQPHRYSRTKELAKDFPPAFGAASKVYLTSIYGAGEKPLKGVGSELIKEEFQKKTKVICINDMSLLKKRLLSDLKKGDIFITLGAGNICCIGEEIIRSF